MILMLARKGADFDNEDIIWIATEIFVFITFAYFVSIATRLRLVELLLDLYVIKFDDEYCLLQALLG